MLIIPIYAKVSNKICHFANHPYLCKGLKEKKICQIYQVLSWGSEKD
ncbi:hypothetical protein [Candidatus Thiodubiliella endoseptemdiera]